MGISLGLGLGIGDSAVAGGGGSVPWWMSLGFAPVAAYAACGAADLAASYVNLANPGTNNAAPGIAPTWDAVGGWTFNGTTQYLTTGITPDNDQTWSALCLFSNGPTTTNAALFGCLNTTAFEVIPSSASLGGVYGNGNTVSGLTAKTSGVVGIAGNRACIDGSFVGAAILTTAGTFLPIYIGGRNMSSALSLPISAKIQAFIIFDVALTAGQVATLTTAMQNL